MKVTLYRKYSNENETIGIISIDDKFECYSLEDEYREKKVWGETRIPAGKYKLRLNKSVGKNKKYFHRFPDIHQGMIEVADVPNFKYILIHIGNSDKDTAGCLLIGKKYYYENYKYYLSHSTDAYRDFYEKVIDDVIAENAEIEIIDGVENE